MTFKYVLAAAVVLGFAGAAVAADASQFVIIKDKNQNCRVVEKNVVSEDELGSRSASRPIRASRKPISTSRSSAKIRKPRRAAISAAFAFPRRGPGVAWSASFLSRC